MTTNEVFQNTLAQFRKAVDACVNEMAVMNDAAARVAWALAAANELKVALSTLRQTAAECPAATEERYKAVVISSEKQLTANIEDHELQQAVLGEIKAAAKVSCETVFHGLNALKALCLNDQHLADVDALLAEITACQTVLRD